jgi:hypothetical protein
MNKPTQTLRFSEAEFRDLLNSNSFATNGDPREGAYHASVTKDFPKIEEFWQHFVVPLTNRIVSNRGQASIGFRDGVDARLQYISGANYSLFVHLAMARDIAKNWTDASLDAVYARLASAFDVFEGLVIQIHFLLSECRGEKSMLVEELSLNDFLRLAEQYYNKEYPKLHEYYVSVGKNVKPIRIPTGKSVFDEFFKGHPERSEYLTISGGIRALRNAIVHDVRVGMVATSAGEFLIPKPSKVQDYRQWSKVEAVARDAAKIASDFCEVKTQCHESVENAMRVINQLYEFIVDQFADEFYSEERSTLREYFGIQFQNESTIAPSNISLELPPPLSGAYAATAMSGVSGVIPVGGAFNTDRRNAE